MGKEYRSLCPIGFLKGIKNFVAHALICYDGQYKLLYGNRSFPYGFRKCSMVTSSNLLDWKNSKTVIRPLFLEPSCINAGAAINRNGKTVYLYHKRTLLCDSIRMSTTTDFTTFEKHPIPVFTAKKLPKKARGIGVPRIVKSGDHYYMVISSKVSKGGMVLLYRSPNLIDWSLRGMLSCETQKFQGTSDYPALIQVDGKHILLERRTKKSGKVFGYRMGSARMDEGCFTPFTEFKALDIVNSPRITTLPDGRTVLIGGLENIAGGCTGLALPKEIICEDNFVRLKPLRELYDKRAGERAAAFIASRPVTEIEGVYGRMLELNVFADLTNAKTFRIMAFMTGCRGLFITFCKENGVAMFDFSTLLPKNSHKKGVITVPLEQTKKIDVQLLLLEDRFECFINGGKTTVSRGLDARLTGAQIGFDAEGDVPCEIVAYYLI